VARPNGRKKGNRKELTLTQEYKIVKYKIPILLTSCCIERIIDIEYCVFCG